MLVLCRKKAEGIIIGDNVTITVVTINNRHVRLAISAPDDVRILRDELLRKEEPKQSEPPNA